MFIRLFLFSAILCLVKSDDKCDNYFVCFGEVLQNFFGIGNYNTTLKNNDAVTSAFYEIKTEDEDLNIFTQNASKALRDEVEKKLKVKLESELFKQLNNFTDAHVKIFNVDERKENEELIQSMFGEELSDEIEMIETNLEQMILEDLKNISSLASNNFTGKLEITVIPTSLNVTSEIRPMVISENDIVTKLGTGIIAEGTNFVSTDLNITNLPKEIKIYTFNMTENERDTSASKPTADNHNFTMLSEKSTPKTNVQEVNESDIVKSEGHNFKDITKSDLMFSINGKPGNVIFNSLIGVKGAAIAKNNEASSAINHSQDADQEVVKTQTTDTPKFFKLKNKFTVEKNVTLIVIPSELAEHLKNETSTIIENILKKSTIEPLNKDVTAPSTVMPMITLKLMKNITTEMATNKTIQQNLKKVKEADVKVNILSTPKPKINNTQTFTSVDKIMSKPSPENIAQQKNVQNYNGKSSVKVKDAAEKVSNITTTLDVKVNKLNTQREVNINNTNKSELIDTIKKNVVTTSTVITSTKKIPQPKIKPNLNEVTFEKVKKSDQDTDNKTTTDVKDNNKQTTKPGMNINSTNMNKTTYFPVNTANKNLDTTTAKPDQSQHKTTAQTAIATTDSPILTTTPNMAIMTTKQGLKAAKPTTTRRPNTMNKKGEEKSYLQDLKEFINRDIDTKNNEIPKSDFNVDSYYDIEDNATDYPVIDYIELYKDTTNEDVLYVPTEIPVVTEIIKNKIETKDKEIDNVIEYQEIVPSYDANNNIDLNATCSSITSVTDTFPWIAAIFAKNGTNNQFDYVCDGALVNERTVVTAARCAGNNTSADIDNFIVILGKRSLLAMAEHEKVFRVQKLKVHENFTNGETVTNDIALLVLEQAAPFGAGILPACSNGNATDGKNSATTGWASTGDLTPINLSQTEDCAARNKNPNVFCASYGIDVAVCPSFGGLYLSQREDVWSLRGILSADPQKKGVCFDRGLVFTSLSSYTDWILYNIDH